MALRRFWDAAGRIVADLQYMYCLYRYVFTYVYIYIIFMYINYVNAYIYIYAWLYIIGFTGIPKMGIYGDLMT